MSWRKPRPAQRSRPRLAGNAGFHGINRRLQSARDLLGLIGVSRPRTERAHRHHDVVEAAVAIVEERYGGAFELRLELCLAAVGDHEIGPQRNDLLGVGIDQRANGRQRSHLGRLDIVRTDGDHLWPRADRVENFRHVGH
jgi:hypothetical protein